jgi:hypothetical protein
MVFTQSNTPYTESLISYALLNCVISIAQIGNQETHLRYGLLSYSGQVFINGHLKRLVIEGLTSDLVLIARRRLVDSIDSGLQTNVYDAVRGVRLRLHRNMETPSTSVKSLPFAN